MHAFKDRTLTCPACDRVPLEFRGDRWACTACRGVFVEAAALVAIITAVPPAPWEPPPSSMTPGARACPLCAGSMAIIVSEGVTLDRLAAHGFWFDDAELGTVAVVATQVPAVDSVGASVTAVLRRPGVAAMGGFDRDPDRYSARVTLDDDVRAELAALEAAGRLRVPRIVDGAQGVEIALDGQRVVSFASNDYLGLAGDARLVRAGVAALESDGAGAGSSRLVVGNHRRHAQLERDIADWLQVGGVQLFGTGFAANLGVMTTLARAGDVVFSDALNHASIIDGCRLARARVVVFPHRDHAALEAGLRSAPATRRIVVTESLFSMDGDHADLEAVAALCRRYDAVMVVDEAHAIGAVGPEGRGLAAGCGVTPDVLVGTFGKAFGGFGAFVASSAALAALLWNRARSLIFSTGSPPHVAATASAALALVRDFEGADLRRTLDAHARQLRKLVSLGGAPGSAIAPLVVGDDHAVMQRTEALLSRGFFVQGIRPPTVPAGTARLRISLSAAHTSAQVAALAEALR